MTTENKPSIGIYLFCLFSLIFFLTCEKDLSTASKSDQIQLSLIEAPMVMATTDSTSNTEILIFPNPFKDYCYISVNKVNISKLQILISDENGSITEKQFFLVEGNALLKADFSEIKQDGVFICDIVIDKKIWRYDLIKSSN